MGDVVDGRDMMKMSEFKHTSGPWEYRHEYYNEPDLDHSGDFGTVVSSEDDPWNIALIHDVDMDGGESLANALLIAAAPDMLDVLLRLTADIDRGGLDNYHQDWIDALAAVAKATGETP